MILLIVNLKERESEMPTNAFVGVNVRQWKHTPKVFAAKKLTIFQKITSKVNFFFLIEKTTYKIVNYTHL